MDRGECACRRSGDVLRLVAEMRSSVFSSTVDEGDLGRVSASREATLKLLILLLALGCGGTVGLVMAERSGVTVIPDDFIMNCVEFRDSHSLCCVSQVTHFAIHNLHTFRISLIGQQLYLFIVGLINCVGGLFLIVTN